MELDDEYEFEPSEPLSQACIALINSILTADVPEDNFLRDTDDTI